jgi:hypothetical protein
MPDVDSRLEAGRPDAPSHDPDTPDGQAFEPAYGGDAGRRAHWPLEVDEVIERPNRDPWISIVRQSIDDYRLGRPDRASHAWDAAIIWRVTGHGPVGPEQHGPAQIFRYHRLLARLTRGTFRQRLLALEGSRGPVVEAHLRTTAARADKRLDIPTLIVFELAGPVIRRITEIPGDQAAWATFWTD